MTITSLCGLVLRSRGKTKAAEVESVKIASVSCLSLSLSSLSFFLSPSSSFLHSPHSLTCRHLPLRLPSFPLFSSSPDGNPSHLPLFLLLSLLISEPPSSLWSKPLGWGVGWGMGMGLEPKAVRLAFFFFIVQHHLYIKELEMSHPNTLCQVLQSCFLQSCFVFLI